MNKRQILLTLLFIACCCITLTTSLRCQICNSSLGQNCNNYTATATCDPALAQQTVNYGLQYLVANATQLNATSSTYRCVFDYISTENSNHSYLGCVYSNLDICKFTPLFYTNRRCGWCSGDNCNRSSAERANYSIYTMIATIILASVAKIMNS